ncbi:MAG: hypothetical protein P4L50_18625 [Anaerolineaceae bacterium]|nr:hypothetical protein [Anaerolineaceae bacterium]
MTRFKFSVMLVLLILITASCVPTATPAVSPTASQIPTKIPDTETPVPPTPIPPTATASPTAVPPTAIPTSTLAPIVTINSDQTSVQVFSAADASSPRLGWLKPGDQVAAFAYSPAKDWIEIGFSLGVDNKGWVSASQVSLSENGLAVIVPTGQPATAVPSPVTGTQAAVRPEDITAIGSFLRQQTFQYKFLGQATYLNNPQRTIDQYQVNGTIFGVDQQSNLLIQIDATKNSHSPSVTKQYSPADLQTMAMTLIHQQAPGVDLSKLTAKPGSKINNYFFRWEEQSPVRFIQVGITIYGELLSYDNALSDPVNG